MEHMGYLFAANLFVWAGICFYLFRLIKQNQSLKKDLELLKESLKR